MRGQIQSVEVSYLVHATEDRNKILSAVVALFGFMGEEKAEVLEGHFGNVIVHVQHQITGEEAERAFSAMVTKMPSSVRNRLKDEMGKYLDEHSALYVRLDKQRLLAGELTFADSDAVRVRVKPRLRTVRGGGRSLFQRLLS